MLDGGIVDSIPVMHAIETGHQKNVLILTRNRGYRPSGRDHKIPHFIYKKYPRLRVALSRRIEAYRQQLEMVEQLEDEGKVICIRPERPMEVTRMEKDTAKLERLYEEGFALGERQRDEHDAFLLRVVDSLGEARYLEILGGVRELTQCMERELERTNESKKTREET